ncbi:FecCD family ABC transporter permease [Timonella sp. A28]|uniref:FecCD family ABC transporter permease n=1 Tax=Timonella sp. A28 TaxID=3442640 RepID=UPI003EBA03CD
MKTRVSLTPPIVLIIACVGLTLAILASVLLGGKITTLRDAIDAFNGVSNPHITGVFDARINRTIMGVLCGSALAVSGLIIQGITRNPLGDPGLLGISSGAAAAVVTAAAVTGSSIGTHSIWVALVGAGLTAVVVYAVSARTGTASIITLLLTGAVISAILSAYIQAIILTKPAVFNSFRFWVIGSLGGRDTDITVAIAPIIAAAFVLAALLATSLNNISLGDDVAAALGTRVTLVRALALAAAASLAAAATAAVGPIAFVGLVVPHLAKSFIRWDHRWLLPITAILGATLLLLADTVGRVIARPEEIGTGIMTAFIGAPFLLYAVNRGWATR